MSRSQAPEAGSLGRGAAATTLATALSRATGFIRVVAVAAAMGTTFLANTYQTANTAPNIVFELVAAGVLTSVFVPTFVEYLVKGEKEEGWQAANALASVALAALVALAVLIAVLAPWVMRLLTLGVADDALRDAEIALGTDFLRLFAPQVVLYGACMIMTGALQAHRRFWLPAIAPIFNNVVVIVVYVAYALMRAGDPPSVEGISTAETLLLGLGTTAGVVAMTLSLVPQLARLGWRFRWRFEPAHPAVRRGARLGVWALGYAGGYQAGLVVVLLFANRVAGGVAAYQWAYTFFYLPHALFAMPIFNVLFTAMSEHVVKRQRGDLLERLRSGLAMMIFILAPVAAVMLAGSYSLARLTLEYGVMTREGTALVGRVIAAFVVGLPTYSTFLVFTRAFYALGDTKTPALVNLAAAATASVLGAALFLTLPAEWRVPGLALGHSIAFAAGAVALASVLARQTGRLSTPAFAASLRRSVALAAAALLVMLVARGLLQETSKAAAVTSLTLLVIAGGTVYLGGMAALRSPELARLRRLFRRSGAHV